MCSIVDTCSTVMHAEHSEGSCWPLIPVHRHVEVQKRWLEGGGGGGWGGCGVQTNKQSENKKKTPSPAERGENRLDAEAEHR